MQTFEQAITNKYFVSATGETVDGIETWPVWQVMGVCSAPEHRPIRDGGADPWAGDLVILQELGDARIDLRTAHDFRSDGYLFNTIEAAAAYSQLCAREDAAEKAADGPAFEEGDA